MTCLGVLDKRRYDKRRYGDNETGLEGGGTEIENYSAFPYTLSFA